MKTRLLFGILVAASMVALSSRVANASIVLNYSFNDDGEARLVSMESELAHAIWLSIQGGDGLCAVLVGDEIAADGSRLPVLRIRPSDAGTVDAAFTNESYLTFSFQTVKESELGLRTLEFDVSKEGEASEFGCVVQSSLDGFGSGRPVLLVNPVKTEHSDKIHYSVDLSGERFQDLTEVDFRVYFYSSQSDQPLEFDGIQLNGEVIVAPEPGSSIVWLMLAGVLFLAAVGWTASRTRTTWSYATVGRSRTPVDSGPGSRITSRPTLMVGRGRTPVDSGSRDVWSDQTREAILRIIDHGRMG